MYRRSANVQFHRDPIAALLEALGGTIGLAEVLDGASLKLFTNSPTLGPDMAVGDFTVATFGGYAAVTPLTWLGPANANGNGMLLTVQGFFLSTDPIAPAEIVNGYYLTNAGNTEVFLAETFDDPVNFAVPGDFLDLDVVLETPFIWPVTAV